LIVVGHPVARLETAYLLRRLHSDHRTAHIPLIVLEPSGSGAWRVLSSRSMFANAPC
jgi:hypothetical protein